MSLYTIDGVLNTEWARRALVRCTDIIIESTIDPFVLARKVYSKEIIPEDVYKRVRDNQTRDSKETRLEEILDCLKSRIEHNANILKIFVDILRQLSQNDLADNIVAKYKG